MSARRVLVVEDDRDLRALLAEEIGASTGLFAESGADAIALLSAMPEIGAVVTDLNLGYGPSGLDVLRYARVLNPRCARVVVTAQRELALERGPAALVEMVFEKPWLFGTIRAYLRDRIGP